VALFAFLWIARSFREEDKNPPAARREPVAIAAD